MGTLTRDGAVEIVSRDQFLRRERGQKNIYFPYSGDNKQDWQPHPVGPYSAIISMYYACVCMYVCMYVWSSHIAEYGSTE